MSQATPPGRPAPRPYVPPPAKIKSLTDFLCGLLFMGLGGGAALIALNPALHRLAEPGERLLPLGLSLVLGLLGVALLFKALTIETEAGDPVEPVAWRALLTVVAVVGVQAYLLSRWGLLPVTLLAAALLDRVGGRRGAAARAAALALTLVGALALCHAVGLGLPWWPGGRLV